MMHAKIPIVQELGLFLIFFPSAPTEYLGVKSRNVEAEALKGYRFHFRYSYRT